MIYLVGRFIVYLTVSLGSEFAFVSGKKCPHKLNLRLAGKEQVLVRPPYTMC